MMTDEFNSNIEEKDTWKQPNVQVNTTINPKIWNLAKRYSLSWQEALEFGILFLLADKEFIDEYPNCKLLEKLTKLQKEIEIKNEA